MKAPARRHIATETPTPLALKVALAAGAVAVVLWNTGLPGQAKREAEQRVRETLLDPESARFSDVQTHEVAGEVHVCGVVNAKNSLGGYVGRRRFIVTGALVVTEAGGYEGIFPDWWRQRCHDT